MTRARTYYDLFEVSRSAGPAEIRAAYLRLMKRHHPDIAGQGSGAADLTAALNQAYAALSDPAKRAAYDAELRGRMVPTIVPPADRRTAAGAALRRRWDLVAGMAMTGVLACVALLAPAAAGSSLLPDLGNSFDFLLPAAPEKLNAAHIAMPPSKQIRWAARLGASATPMQAEQRSAQCFAAAQSRGNLSEAQLCVVFDDAYLYSRRDPAGTLQPYFDEVVVKTRHASALAPVDGAERLLDQLWNATFSALLADLRQSASAVEEAPAANVEAEENAESAEVSAPQRDRNLTSAGTS